MDTFRLLDLPPMTAAEHMALDDVLLALKGDGKTLNTVRFLQFSPPAVLLGHHQAAEEEIRSDYCRKMGIQVNRRITGGGAVFLDERQLGWEIICDKTFLNVDFITEKLFQRLCEPVIRALAKLGVRAEFRPRNDIEVNGRKISGTGGTELYGALLFHGTILMDGDISEMLGCLNIPVEKLSVREIDSIRQRVTSMTAELGSIPPISLVKAELVKAFEKTFDIHLESMPLTEKEEAMMGTRLPFFQSEAWIHLIKSTSRAPKTLSALKKFDSGMVRFTLTIHRNNVQVKDFLITGDMLSFPSRGVYDLMAEIKGAPLDHHRIRGTIEKYFENGLIHIPGMTCSEFIQPLDSIFEALGGICPA
ncbi:MAG: lipoate--protein ligase family protein [Desulfobacterales bacterium]